MKRETGSWHPVMRAKRKELKKTLEENRQHGERRRKLNKKEDGGVKIKGSQKNQKIKRDIQNEQRTEGKRKLENSEKTDTWKCKVNKQ